MQWQHDNGKTNEQKNEKMLLCSRCHFKRNCNKKTGSSYLRVGFSTYSKCSFLLSSNHLNSWSRCLSAFQQSFYLIYLFHVYYLISSFFLHLIQNPPSSLSMLASCTSLFTIQEGLLPLPAGQVPLSACTQWLHLSQQINLLVKVFNMWLSSLSIDPA